MPTDVWDFQYQDGSYVSWIVAAAAVVVVLWVIGKVSRVLAKVLAVVVIVVVVLGPGADAVSQLFD